MALRGKNLIVEKSASFSLAIIEFCDLLDSQKRFFLSQQLLKSATSISANVFEAQNAESRADFIHKMKIAAKEAEETSHWLLMCENSKNYPFKASLKIEIREIILILAKIISTAKQNAR